MKRYVRMFRARFAAMVESGQKCQTIRPTPKRVIEVGGIIDCRAWMGTPYRSKQRKLMEAKIVGTRYVTIWPGRLVLDGGFCDQHEREQFARLDGFSDFADMAKWFSEVHGLPFTGVAIFWEKP